MKIAGIKKLLYLKQKNSSVFLTGFTQLENFNKFNIFRSVVLSTKKISNREIFGRPDSLTGFTLIELLIAISVFMIGIMGAFSLSLHNLNTARENYQRVIAADLAREGIELVRNVRDSNWLAREANVDNPDTIELDVYNWDQNFTKKNFLVDYDTVGFINFDVEPADLADAIIDSKSILYLNNNFYSHDSAGSPTVFRRAINLQAICLDDSIPGSPVESIETDLICNSAQEKIGFQVTSRVQYTYGGRTQILDAVEKIYNWRQ